MWSGRLRRTSDKRQDESERPDRPRLQYLDIVRVVQGNVRGFHVCVVHWMSRANAGSPVQVLFGFAHGVAAALRLREENSQSKGDVPIRRPVVLE